MGSTSLAKLGKNPRLSEVASVLGSATVTEAYELSSLIHEVTFKDEKSLRLVNSGTIDRYSSLWGQKPCRYLGAKYMRPGISKEHEIHLPKIRRAQSRSPKIIIAGMTKVLECCIDETGSLIAGKSTTIVFGRIDLVLLLGVLNSRVAAFFYNSTFGGNKLQGDYLRIGPPQVRKIPVPEVVAAGTGKSISQLKTLVERMLKLHADLPAARTDQQKTVLERQIATVDNHIDQLVYELYGLTDAEIALVEEATAR